MTRGRTRALAAAILALAAMVFGPVESFGAEKSAAAVSGRARVTMDELEIRGYERHAPRMFVPPVPDLFHRSPVRFDLIREDLARPIPLSEIGRETRSTGGYLVDDD